MKKIFYPIALWALTAPALINAQDLQVTGVSTGRGPTTDAERIDIYSPVGGNKPTDFKIIDEPAYECIYDYIISTTDKQGNPVKENFVTILLLGNNAGRFTDYAAYKADSVAFSANPDKDIWAEHAMAVKNEEYRFTGDILLNSPQGELTYTDIVTPFYQEYTETYPAIEWQIGEKQDTICGYLCTVATGSYGGRDWEAWFTEEIPSDMGPWKFGGLPGLIMKVKDSEGVHDFNAISFREGKTPVAKPNNSLIQKTSRDRFIETKQKFERNPTASINPEFISNIYVIKKDIIINGVEVPRRPNGYTPIELK